MKNPETRQPPPPPDSRVDDERSIFGEILDWMLAPLLFLWPIGIAVTHYFVEEVTSRNYDAALSERVVALAGQVGGAAVSAGGDAFRVLRGDGRVLAASGQLPEPPSEVWQADTQVRLRQVRHRGVDLQIAALTVGDKAAPPERRVLVEIGENREKRTQFTNRLVAGVLIPQFILIPMAVALVWFGLKRGLRPLARLQTMLAARELSDLSPIAPQRVPEELESLLVAFNAMLKRMRRNVDAQQRFIADAAHQLRTPLAGLKMQAQLAERESDAVALQHALKQIANSADRAARLAGQLLTLARTESGEIGPARFVRLDLDGLLRECVEEWITRALAKQIDLGYEAGGEAPVLGDAFLLHEMLNNLIDNALRYTPAGGCVTCRVRRNGEFYVLEVEDNGIGISLDDVERVFERFYRVNDAHSEGSGLGLAIVREIASRHGAFAALRPNSKVQGVTARVVFPGYEPASPEAAVAGER